MPQRLTAVPAAAMVARVAGCDPVRTGPEFGSLRMRWSVSVPALVWLGTGAVLAEGVPAAPGSFRAAQETGLDLSLRPVDLVDVDAVKGAAGSFRAAQEVGLTTPWSRAVGPKWSLEGYQGPAGPPPWEGAEEPVGIKLKRDL